MEIDQLLNALLGQIGVDGGSAVTQQRREMMHISGFPALKNHGERRPLLGLHQILLQCGNRQQRRDRHMIFIHSPVGKDNDIGALPEHPVRLHIEMIDRFLQGSVLIVNDRNDFHLEAVHLHILDLHQIRVGQDRMIDAQRLAVILLLLQHISRLAEIDRRGGNHLLTDGVDGRVCHLGKQLLEIVEQRLMLLGEDRQGRIDSHSPDLLSAV